MVIELVLIFATLPVAFAVHLGHLLQAVKDGGDDALVLLVDDAANVEVVGAIKLRLDPRDEELLRQARMRQMTSE